MKYSWTHEVKISVIFTDEEFDFLTELIKTDSNKSVIKPGGFWYDLKALRKFYRNEENYWLIIGLDNIDNVILPNLRVAIKEARVSEGQVKLATKLLNSFQSAFNSGKEQSEKLNSNEAIIEINDKE